MCYLPEDFSVSSQNALRSSLTSMPQPPPTLSSLKICAVVSCQSPAPAVCAGVPGQQLQFHTPSCWASLYYLQCVPFRNQGLSSRNPELSSRNPGLSSRNPGLSVKLPTQTSPLVLSRPPCKVIQFCHLHIPFLSMSQVTADPNQPSGSTFSPLLHPPHCVCSSSFH